MNYLKYFFLLTFLFREMSDSLTDESMVKLDVYDTKHFFRGQQIDPESIPPENLTEGLLDGITCSMIHTGFSDDGLDVKKHFCDNKCAMETFVVMGRPFTRNLKDSVDW